MKIITCLIISFNIFALHNRISESQKIIEGYSPVQYKYVYQSPLPESNLDWPFEKFYSEGEIGNNFAQYQPYSLPGYHGGVDMILEKDSWVVSPISGKLEAGHYGYTDNPNGTGTKIWKAWPKKGDAAYFEVAIIDENGNRFELHHIDRKTLTKEVISSLNSHSPKIRRGQRIARVYRWGTFFHYHHIHLNIVRPNGEHLNPERFFTPLWDNIAPKVKFLAEYEDGTRWVRDADVLTQKPTSIIVFGYDKKNDNRFNQAPLYYELKFKKGAKTLYDFTVKHINEKGLYADIRKVYPKKVILPNKRAVKQAKGFYPNKVHFITKLSIPKNIGTGDFIVTVKDINNNQTSIKAKISL